MALVFLLPLSPAVEEWLKEKHVMKITPMISGPSPLPVLIPRKDLGGIALPQSP